MYAQGAAATTNKTAIDFDRDIRPILSNACYNCHGPDDRNRKADLRLDTRAGAFADLGGYRAIVPGQPEKSEVYKRITSTEPAERMPPPKAHRQLKAREIERLRDWIAQGAPWQEHWAFVPPKRPPLPPVKKQDWPINAIDHFILARLEQAGLQPSPVAAKEKWLRRVTLDLTGLPPTLAEIDAFLADSSPTAQEKVVDRLLSSPHYGEQMALPWLDAARYADTNGYQQEATRTMWPWRDWLIQALNDNMPYDQFTVQMLAGDLLPGATTTQKVATGFQRNHMLNGEGGRNPEESRVEYVIDRVETTATVWLGLTMGCCRCHNHKYDPISQKEFYRFYAFFNSIDEVGGVDRRGNAKPVLPLPTAEQTKKQQELTEQLARLQQQLNQQMSADALSKWEQEICQQIDRGASKQPAKLVEIVKIEAGKRSKEQQQELQKQFRQAHPDIAALQKQLDDTQKARTNLEQSFLEVMVMQERPQPRATYLLKRGEWDKADTSEKLLPAVPGVLPPLPAGVPNNRLGLARWLIDPAHPLTARVAVNRYWQQFFGTGLVKTAEDFGTQGERPSHPELLDWLAVEFREGGWNVKHIHKLIVLSAAYRQSSQTTPELLQRDPANRLISRGPRERLSALVIRDQALALSGLLSERMGGPGVKPYQPDVWYDLSLGKVRYQRDQGESLYRRSIYTFWKRSVGPTMFFDQPARQVCTVRQAVTNTPLHALTLLNDETYIEAARVFAQHLLKEAATPEQRLARAFRLAASRPPSAEEQQALLQVLHKLQDRYKGQPDAAQKLVSVGEYPRDAGLDVVELAAYTGVMNLILNLDEVITKE